MHAHILASALLLAPCVFLARAQAMTYSEEKVNGKTCDVVAWTDDHGKKRTVALVRADGDVKNFKGGYIERYTYFVGEKETTGMAWNQSQESVSGLGCAVNHGKGARGNKRASDASTSFVLKGERHCVWRFKGGCGGANGKTVGLTIDYAISEGRKGVLWSVSYDCSKLDDGEIGWDARGPYVQFDWDHDGRFYDGKISGIRWGDRYKFKTVNYVFGQPAECTWDYTEPNTIPYMLLWKDAALGDIELGMVQTQPWDVQDAGGYWWFDHWKQTGKGMPVNWNCPYQLNAYENYSSEKMAWGTNYGYVGNANYEVLGASKKAKGHPHQGYAVEILLNRASEALVDRTIAGMEAVQQTKFTASRGTVAAQGPRYAGLDPVFAYVPAGWNHVRAAWTLAAQENAAQANFAVAKGALCRPILAVTNYAAAALPRVAFNGQALKADEDYAASLDAANRTLYLTLFRDLSGEKNELSVEP
ncbi:MAG: hypothetical protein KIS92_21920 [Planctomycetota bacterium]|nr:hypothetical protein [Planctomycetota bacterium]